MTALAVVRDGGGEDLARVVVRIDEDGDLEVDVGSLAAGEAGWLLTRAVVALAAPTHRTVVND